MANPFAALLVDHVTDRWEVLADLDRPGIAAKVAAVRAGDAPTTVLPVDVAVRVIGELDDPVTAAASDNRVKVQAALKGAAAANPAPRSPQLDPRTAKVFTGTAEQLCERIDQRRSALTDAHIDAWLTLDDATRDATRVSVLAACTVTGAAAVLIDDAARHGTAVTQTTAAAGRHLRRNQTSVNGSERRKRRSAIRGGITAALGAWLRDHSGGAPWSVTAPHTGAEAPTLYPHPVPEAAGEGLAALAGRTATYFAGPPHLAELALSQPRTKTNGLPAARENLLLCGADSGLSWATIRRLLYGEEALSAAELTCTVGALVASPAGRRVAVAGLRTEVWAMGLVPGSYRPDADTVFENFADELTCAEKLRFAAVTNYNDSDLSYPGWTYPVLRYLTGAHAPTRAEITAAANADPVTDTYLERVAAVLDKSPLRFIVDHDNLDELWDRAVAQMGVEQVWDAAKKHRRCAAAWARHCEAMIARTGADPASVWAAAAAVIDRFDGTTTELIDVAAATST